MLKIFLCNLSTARKDTTNGWFLSSDSCSSFDVLSFVARILMSNQAFLTPYTLTKYLILHDLNGAILLVLIWNLCILRSIVSTVCNCCI